LAFDIPRGRVLPVTSLDIRLVDDPHPFELAHAEAIEANWQAEVAANPAYFDGRIVLLSEYAYRDGVLAGICHPIRFATLLYWRKDRTGYGVEHTFAYAVLVASDGALIAIRMGAHTANPRQVYFAAGSFEPEDFPGGQVDMDFNMRREVGEETGLDLDAGTPEADRYLYSENGSTVLFRRWHLDEPADVLAARIAAHVAADPDPEIEGPVVIRPGEPMPDGTRPHMAAIVRWHFANA